MTMEFVPGMDIGNVNFKHRPLERLDGIDDGDRGEGVGRRVDDDGVRALPCRLDQVDQLALMVRLVKGKRKPEALRVLLAAFLDLRQCRGSVDVRLPYAQKIEVGTVQDH